MSPSEPGRVGLPAGPPPAEASEAEPGRTLSLAFMRQRPVQAARVLEALPAAQAAALFERAPARLGADVLAAMMPPQAARCLAELPDERVLELLSPMAMQPTVGVLRHVPEPRRRLLVARLPTASALASRLLLGYGEDTLGAWADPDILLLSADRPADEALARLRAGGGAHPCVFVTDAERRLRGVVGLLGLLQAPPEARLGSLMRAPAAVLPAHAPLAGSLDDPAWEQASTLPVAEPGGRLLGVLTHDALARALRRATPPPDLSAEAPWPRLAAHGYWQATSGLLRAGLSLLPRVPPLAAPPRDER